MVLQLNMHPVMNKHNLLLPYCRHQSSAGKCAWSQLGDGCRGEADWLYSMLRLPDCSGHAQGKWLKGCRTA